MFLLMKDIIHEHVLYSQESKSAFFSHKFYEVFFSVESNFIKKNVDKFYQCQSGENVIFRVDRRFSLSSEQIPCSSAHQRLAENDRAKYRS